MLLCISGGTDWWIVISRPTTPILHHHFDLDRGFDHRVHRIPKKRRTRLWKEVVPRWSIWSTEFGQRPREKSHLAIGGDQACPSCHGGIPRVRCPSSGHRKGTTQQLGYTFERSTSHHHPRHLRLLLLNPSFLVVPLIYITSLYFLSLLLSCKVCNIWQNKRNSKLLLLSWSGV